ncbi:hypothetical protein MKY85_20630 [Paenibacillus sp. FSL R5-0749]|uniref:hypothetical protein n=1 Tax=Paenibacillus sp. FSL R5-0749 TaxID=2921657 RepID=UPI00315A8602
MKFVEELFPSISPYTREEVKRSIRQFETLGRHTKFCLAQPFEFLSQGDIIGNIPFVRFNEKGEQSTLSTKGMLISNTCDAENDDSILFAPLVPLSKITGDIHAMKNNLNYRLLYIPDADLDDYIVDLSLVNSYSRKLIEGGMTAGKIQKFSSLNKLGYYLFLSKLTVHMMRPEDSGVQSMRTDIAG